MKKLLLVAFVFCSLLASAQQETFEFLDINDVQNPFTKENAYISPSLDEKGRTWVVDKIASGYQLKNYTDTIKINLNKSPKEKEGYSYIANDGVIVDELKNKLVKIHGSKYTSNAGYYDSYIIKYDSLGKTTYIYLKDLSLQDSTKNINQYQIIGGKLLLYSSKYIWQGNPSADITSLGNGWQYLITDKKKTLFAISSSIDYNNVIPGLWSFHSDGSYQKRLPNTIVSNYNFDAESNTMTICSKSGIYELNGKNDKAIVIPSSASLLNSSSISSLSKKQGNFKLDIVLTKKGFNVRDGSNSSSYLFASNKLIGADSLQMDRTTLVNLQKDSTLVIGYKNNSNNIFLFTYKNGVAKFHKRYNNLPGFYGDSLAFYVDKKETYLYFITDSHINQIRDDSTLTTIYNPHGPKYINIYRITADKDYFWIENSKLARLRHDAYFVQGKVFYDANKNGYKDNSEFGYSKIKLIAQPSGLQLTPDYDGNFAFKGEFGKSYKIDVADSTRFSWISKDIYTIGVKLKDEKPEVNASFWLPRARCFTKLPASFYLQNTGVVPVEKVVIRLVPNKMKLLQNSTLVDTATFTYQNLGVHQSASLAYDIEWPEAELTGQTATLKTITDLYVNGVVASRKIDSVQTIIRCSYDPNDKSVTPAGVGDQFYTLKTGALQYQIRFENTGNDTAYHVAVQDTLDKNLDFSTFEVLGSSHKMNTEISKDGVIGFHFNYINLPDSTTNKKGAQGFVRFSIKPKTSVANNTLLCNKAAIYFDQNKPVITNSTCNLLVDKIPTNPLGIETVEISVGNNIYPNPTNDWIYLPKEAEETTVYNILGSQVLKSTETKVNMAGFEEGIYIAKVRAKNGKVSTHKISVVR